MTSWRAVVRWPSARIAVAGLLVLVLLLEPMVGFAAADFMDTAATGRSIAGRARAVWQDGDRLHFAVHLAAGRALEVCPCTRDMAGVEYWRASFHARQPWQVEHLNLRRPATVESWL